MVLYAGNAAMIIIAPVNHLTRGGVQNANLRNQLLQGLFFTTVNSLSAKLFISLITYARERKTSPHMNLRDVSR